MNSSLELVGSACRKCGTVFAKSAGWIRSNGHKCPSCVRTAMRVYVAKYRGKSKYEETRHRKHRATTIATINALKAHPCMDCGGSFRPHQMDFDHVRGDKNFAISASIHSNRPIDAVLEEIKKCDLVCANCHRDRTHTRNYPTPRTKRIH